ANRENARRSTGPRTPAGKQAVRWNALKHGLLAREVIIRHGDGAEDPRAFQSLQNRLWAELQPEGIQEGMVVEEIAVCLWRQRRVLRAETGEIRLRSDRARSRLVEERMTQMEAAPVEEPLYRVFRQSGVGLDYVIAQVQRVRAEVKKTGEL